LQLFGFKRPIAHAMYLVARLEANLSTAGGKQGIKAVHVHVHVQRAHCALDSIAYKSAELSATALGIMPCTWWQGWKQA
jgi:hypothetical protein